MWPDFVQIQSVTKTAARSLVEDDEPQTAPASGVGPRNSELLVPVASPTVGEYGWPIPSALSTDPEEARARILLPEFDALLIEKARVISGHFPAAQAECRHQWTAEADSQRLDVPHFERVFHIACRFAEVETAPDYDSLLILTAWHCVRPGEPGFLGSYPKALLCPLSHCAPPAALAALSSRQQAVFDRRAPAYLRYLLCVKAGLRSCAEIESTDLRHLLRNAGFRLIRSSAVPAVAFPGITQGDDPPVRPWKLTLRQELSDERAVGMLVNAAIWKIQYELRLVTFQQGVARWNIGAFSRTDWEDAFLSLGVRVAPSLLRESGLIDWRAVLAQCLARIGVGNLPAEVLGKISAWPQRVSHDSGQAIWEALDQVAAAVLERAHEAEPQNFLEDGRLNYEAARSFRCWARLFDEVSPQILSRFGVSAFTALRRVAPASFGWGVDQLKPWEVEQDFGKWKGSRGRGLLRSAYAYALFESGLGRICVQGEQVLWQCTLQEFSDWYATVTVERNLTPYDFLYGLASRHGLTPLLNREVSHTATLSLLAGMNLHEALPQIEGCWELCLRNALEQHGGTLEVRLVLPDLVPLPLRLRKAVLTPVCYGYLHKELRWVRDFDLRMARESRCTLEELPGWWEDERIMGTPLAERLHEPRDSVRPVLAALNPDPWIEPPTRRIRFRALCLLLSPRATNRTPPGSSSLASEEMRDLLRLALDVALEQTNLAQVSVPAVRSGFERLLAREDTREMLDSLLLHIGTAYETEIWGRVRKFIVLDVINDLLALTIRSSLLHLMSADSSG